MVSNRIKLQRFKQSLVENLHFSPNEAELEGLKIVKYFPALKPSESQFLQYERTGTKIIPRILRPAMWALWINS